MQEPTSSSFVSSSSTATAAFLLASPSAAGVSSSRSRFLEEAAVASAGASASVSVSVVVVVVVGCSSSSVSLAFLGVLAPRVRAMIGQRKQKLKCVQAGKECEREVCGARVYVVRCARDRQQGMEERRKRTAHLA